MTDQKCNVSLHQKIADRSGRLQLIMAAMARLAQDVEANIQDETGTPENLANLAHDFGHRWLDECSMLLKELYNRQEGP